MGASRAVLRGEEGGDRVEVAKAALETGVRSHPVGHAIDLLGGVRSRGEGGEARTQSDDQPLGQVVDRRGGEILLTDIRLGSY